jgi:hypothetical protein
VTRNLKQTGSWTWVWYEDVVIDKKRGIRFEFDIRETSDEMYYDESVTIYRFEGEPCINGGGPRMGFHFKNRTWRV